MGIVLSRGKLLSRVVRSSVTAGRLARSLNLSPSLQSNKQDGSGKGGAISQIIKTLTGLGKRFFGFISAVLRGVQITASAIFGTIVNAAQALSTFDWNSSDREIAAMIRANNVALAGVWGSAVGSAAGWVVGIGVGYGITVLCPVIGSASLARIVAGKATAEALEEVGQTTRNALVATAQTMQRNLLLAGYRRFRKIFRKSPADDAPAWTIAGKFEEKIESIKDDALRAFVENAADEFFDSFIEAGFIFAYELDAQIAANKLAKQGTARTVTLIPDKEAREEALVLTGSQTDVTQAIQTTLTSHRLLYNRDVGQIVGQPAEDWIRARPHQRQLTIVFKSREKPPFVEINGKAARSATYSIPDPKVGLEWSKIKKAVKAYSWGRFRCTANLSNGRQMAIYGGTPQAAEEKLRELLDLSNCEILTLSITEEKQRSTKLKKDTIRMYPHSGCLLVRRPSSDAKGRTDQGGTTWDEKLTRFFLWQDQEPTSFKTIRW